MWLPEGAEVNKTKRTEWEEGSIFLNCYHSGRSAIIGHLATAIGPRQNIKNLMHAAIHMAERGQNSFIKSVFIFQDNVFFS